VGKAGAGRAPACLYRRLFARRGLSQREPSVFLKRINSYIAFQDIKPALVLLRTYKDAGETVLMRKAVNASVAAHFAASKAVNPT